MLRGGADGVDIHRTYDPFSTLRLVIISFLMLIVLVLSIVSLSLNVRRWHDLGMTG